VTVPPSPIDDVRRAAERRWQAVIDAAPDLRSAVELQRRLLTRVFELLRAVEAGPLPRLSLPPKYIAAKLSRGVPALRGEPIPVPAPLLGPALAGFCDDLAAGGAGDAARRLGAAIDSGDIDAASLLRASLARDQEAIRSGALQRALSPDLAWLVAELAIGPVAHVLQRVLLAAPGSRTASAGHALPPSHEATADRRSLGGGGQGVPGANPLAEALGGWNEGYCPACGSWPALAEIVERHRLLRCAFCAATWERTTYACVYCEGADDQFVTALPNPARPDRRVELCRSCGAYLKAVDADALSPYPLVAVADMETMELDVAAAEHHFGRPPLRDLGMAPGRR
jgi:FdhE protein